MRKILSVFVGLLATTQVVTAQDDTETWSIIAEDFSQTGEPTYYTSLPPAPTTPGPLDVEYYFGHCSKLAGNKIDRYNACVALIAPSLILCGSQPNDLQRIGCVEGFLMGADYKTIPTPEPIN